MVACRSPGCAEAAVVPKVVWLGYAAGSVLSGGSGELLPLSRLKRTRFSVRGVATGGPSHSGEAGEGLATAEQAAK